MTNRLTDSLNFHSQALLLRAERQRVLASNIANADTPNFKAKDFDFNRALAAATGASAATAVAPARTAVGHQTLAQTAAAPFMQYRVPEQGALDANTVDMDRERANFADNAVRYEASLRFLNGQIKTLMTAINGQSQG
ncbi:MAG: flagellar basal body rod protein FlgB [Burkholderiaceae bacterium]